MAQRKVNDISALLGFPKKDHDTGCRVKRVKTSKGIRQKIVGSHGGETDYFIREISTGKAIVDSEGNVLARFGGRHYTAILRDDGMLSGYSLGGLMGDEFWYHGNRVGEEPIRRTTHPSEQ
ncbi:MAG: hypothetical protein ABIG93_02840 [archaeon]|nr:hypothetical protein [Nanoarchaeota archaeon]